MKPGSLVFVLRDMNNSRFPISLFIHAFIHIRCDLYCLGWAGLFVRNWSLWVGLLPIIWAINEWKIGEIIIGKVKELLGENCPTVNSIHHKPPELKPCFCVDEAPLSCNIAVSCTMCARDRSIYHEKSDSWPIELSQITANPPVCLTVITHDATHRNLWGPERRHIAREIRKSVLEPDFYLMVFSL